MADRPVPQTAPRSSDNEATAPVKKRPVLPPMPEQPKPAADQASSRRPVVLPPAPEEDTAVRAPRGRRLWANLTGAPATEDAEGAVADATAAAAAPATTAASATTAAAPRVAPAPVVRAPKAPKPARAAKAPLTVTPAPGAARRPARRARLRLTRIDPWSVLKTAFLLSIAVAIVIVVSVFIVWTTLGAAGLWDSVNSTVRTVLGNEGDTFDVRDYLGTSRVMGVTIVVAGINAVLMTIVATLLAFLYNMAAALLGGLEVTLTEDAS